MMGHPKQTTPFTSTTDLTEDDHAKRKRERETSADLLNDHDDEEEKTPANAEGLCPPKKRGKETEEDLETTCVRKNMEEMVCQDHQKVDPKETNAGESIALSRENLKGTNKSVLPEEVVVSEDQKRNPQSSSKAVAEFVPSKRAGDTNTASKPIIPPSSTQTYTLPEGAFSRNKDTPPPATSSTTINNPFLKNVGRTNDDDEDDVDEANDVKDAKNSANTRTKENEGVAEPVKKKYAFGQTLGPSAADIGRSTSTTAPVPQTTSASSSSLSSMSTSAFGSKYAGATFGSTAASGNSIFGSGSLGSGATSGASPFAALSATNDSTTSLKQTPSVFDSEANIDSNEIKEDDEEKDDNSDEDDSSNSGDDAAGATFGSTNKVLVPEQEVITGEENETTLHQIKGKLYAMENGQWHERGGGNLKLKISMQDEEEQGNKPGRKPRLVMRTDAVLRLILNTPLFAGMAMKIVQEKFVIFGGVDKDGNPASYGFRAPSPIAAAVLCEAIERALNEYL